MELLDIQKTKDMIKQIVKNHPDKLAKVDNVFQFVDNVFDKNKITGYQNQINQIVEMQKDGVDAIETIQILEIIQDIITDIFVHFETIKIELSKKDRQYIIDNIDIISVVIVSIAIESLHKTGIINDELFIRIIKYVRAAIFLTLNMKIKKYLCFCCK